MKNDVEVEVQALTCLLLAPFQRLKPMATAPMPSSANADGSGTGWKATPVGAVNPDAYTDFVPSDVISRTLFVNGFATNMLPALLNAMS